MHSRTGGIGEPLKPGSLIGPNDGIAVGNQGAQLQRLNPRLPLEPKTTSKTTSN